jgi:eukaryotic-like serine/threonine-protein kinase
METYDIIQEIGRGSFGVTYSAYDNLNNRYVAIKIINKSKVSNSQRLYDEIDVLKYLSSGDCNRFISQYYDSYSDEEQVFIIMEYIDGVTLSKYVSGLKIHINVLFSIYYELAKGLECIHSQGVAHRDIKLENILILPNGYIKYIDFGLSCLEDCIIEGCANICGTRAGQFGTPLYFPPEWKIYKIPNITRIQLAQKGDVWALGIIMYELANNKKYPGPVRYFKYNSKYGSNYGNSIVDNLIIYVLNPDPHTRPTASQLCTEISNIIHENNLISM